MADFDPDKHRIALIAGNGRLPAEIMGELVRNNREPILVGIKGEIEPDLAQSAAAVLAYGQLGSLFDLLKRERIHHVIFAGGINRRPDFKSMKMDMITLKDLPTLLKIVMGGDNSVLSKIASYFAKKNVEVVGAHEVVPGLLATSGAIAGKPPGKAGMPVILQAFRAAKTIGGMDVGQAAIAEDGRILGLEAAEGTDAMIERIRNLRDTGRISKKPGLGVLAKAMKPDQDMRADLPTIGPATVEAVAHAGLKGIVIEAGRTFILEREETLKRAAQNGIFILGLDAGDAGT